MPNALRQQVLARFPALGSLTADELTRLLAAAQWREVPDRTVMFDAHQPCAGFPLLLAGSVRVSRQAPNGREIVLYRVEPGDVCVLSGSCLLGHAAHTATGVAEGAVQVLMIPPAAFDALVLESPAFRQFVFGTYATRLADVITVVEDVAFRRLDARLADLLVTRGPAVSATHQQLAEELGSVREVVSRVLRNFEQRGWVRLLRERIDVIDAAALARFAADSEHHG